MASPTDEIRADFLRRGRNAIVATNRAAAGPQLTPNWYLWDGERFASAPPTGRPRSGTSGATRA